MSYKLLFKTAARKEWNKLDFTVQKIFKKKLAERLKKPHNESSRLSGLKNCYKIKLRQTGYRLVYQVRDQELVVVVRELEKNNLRILRRTFVRFQGVMTGA